MAEEQVKEVKEDPENSVAPAEEQKEQPKKKNWFGWFRNLLSAILGAILSCLATLGIVSKSDAQKLQEKTDELFNKAQLVYVQGTEIVEQLRLAQEKFKEKDYLGALAILKEIPDDAKEIAGIVAELREAIEQAAKDAGLKASEVKDAVSEKVTEIKDTVNDAVQDIKEAAKSDGE